MISRGIVSAAAGAALTACGSDAGPEPPPRNSAATSAPVTGPAPTVPATADTPSADTPSNGTKLVLRWRTTGGIAGLGGPGEIPEFSLYGDGRAIVRPQGGPSPSALREYRLTPDALRRLLAEARAAGLERGRTLGPQDVADAMVLEYTMGSARTRIHQPESQKIPAVRFQKRLFPDGWAPSDQAAPARAYPVERIAVLSGEMASPGGQPKAWPLSPLGKGEQAVGGLCTVFTGRDAKVAAGLARERPDGGWRSGGKVYSARFRPLLPDERTCQDVAKS
ncbi:hypothetical protein ACFVH6_16225 [Spirillospora sp. NPDC127200]